MSKGEGFYITNKGLELISKAVKDETKVDINKVAFGSGGDINAEWDYDITALKSEGYTKSLDPLTDSYALSESDPKTLVIEVVFPIGQALTINEIGFFDSEDNLIIYGLVRERIKEEQDEYQYNCWVKFENTDAGAVNIVIASPEFSKVEEMLNQIEKEFNLDNYVTHEEFETLSGKLDGLDTALNEVLS